MALACSALAEARSGTFSGEPADFGCLSGFPRGVDRPVDDDDGDERGDDDDGGDGGGGVVEEDPLR